MIPVHTPGTVTGQLDASSFRVNTENQVFGSAGADDKRRQAVLRRLVPKAKIDRGFGVVKISLESSLTDDPLMAMYPLPRRFRTKL